MKALYLAVLLSIITLPASALCWQDPNLGVQCNFPTWYHPDEDGDGAGSTTKFLVSSGDYLDPTWVRNGSDCNDANDRIWQNRTVYRDEDHDGYPKAAASAKCTGDAVTINGRTYYDDGLDIHLCGFGSYLYTVSSGLYDADDCNQYVGPPEQG